MSIWTKPRSTIRNIIATNPKRGFFWLASLYSLQSLLFIANTISLGVSYNFFLILILSTALSPLLGSIWIYFYGWLFHLTGKWLGGKAPQLHIRAAFAWSKVPLLINLVMWIFLLIYLAEHAFVHFTEGPLIIFINIVSLFSGIWSLILLIQTLREVQGFSLAMAVGNTALSYAIGFLILLLFTTLLTLFIRR